MGAARFSKTLVPTSQNDALTKRAKYDRLCGLVVRVLGYRSGGPGSIPGTIRFSEGKKKKKKGKQ
jgi:hypothetical protein